MDFNHLVLLTFGVLGWTCAISLFFVLRFYVKQCGVSFKNHWRCKRCGSVQVIVDNTGFGLCPDCLYETSYEVKENV